MSQKRRHIRYLILLSILALVAYNEFWTLYKIRQWQTPLAVNIFAVNADREISTKRYIDQLNTRTFKPVEQFLNQQADQYQILTPAFHVNWRGQLSVSPPLPDTEPGVMDNIVWSLKFRAWSWYQQWNGDFADADINLYVRYFSLDSKQSLEHSVGLKQGMIGIINAFSSPKYAGSNNVVIAHELMHTLGALDKYDGNNFPVHPEGFADPYQQPLFPQIRTEIMGGRMPLNPSRAITPHDLTQVIIGPYTAREIHWIKD